MGAVGGTYLVTMNKDTDGINTADNHLIGYFLAISAATLLGIVYVLLR